MVLGRSVVFLCCSAEILTYSVVKKYITIMLLWSSVALSGNTVVLSGNSVVLLGSSVGQMGSSFCQLGMFGGL